MKYHALATYAYVDCKPSMYMYVHTLTVNNLRMYVHILQVHSQCQVQVLHLVCTYMYSYVRTYVARMLFTLYTLVHVHVYRKLFRRKIDIHECAHNSQFNGKIHVILKIMYF